VKRFGHALLVLKPGYRANATPMIRLCAVMRQFFGRVLSKNVMAACGDSARERRLREPANRKSTDARRAHVIPRLNIARIIVFHPSAKTRIVAQSQQLVRGWDFQILRLTSAGGTREADITSIQTNLVYLVAVLMAGNGHATAGRRATRLISAIQIDGLGFVWPARSRSFPEILAGLFSLSSNSSR
jgi:hypothetical protein